MHSNAFLKKSILEVFLFRLINKDRDASFTWLAEFTQHLELLVHKCITKWQRMVGKNGPEQHWGSLDKLWLSSLSSPMWWWNGKADAGGRQLSHQAESWGRELGRLWGFRSRAEVKSGREVSGGNVNHGSRGRSPWLQACTPDRRLGMRGRVLCRAGRGAPWGPRGLVRPWPATDPEPCGISWSCSQREWKDPLCFWRDCFWEMEGSF